MSSRSKWICLDCNQDTGQPGLKEHYYVQLDLWLSVVGSRTGMLCIGCLESRIGRKLTSKDFPDVTINNPRYEPKSQRLISRLTSKKAT